MNDAIGRFSRLLDAVPYLKPYWDMERRECDLEVLREAMGAWSHGEQIMAQFVAGVWLGKNEHGFDLIEAAATLDEENRAIIGRWLATPFWP